MLNGKLVEVVRNNRYLAEPVKLGLRTVGRIAQRPRIDAYIQAHACRKLQLGAGKNLLPGWLNTDYLPSSMPLVYLDATKRFPIEEQTFDYVFCEHQLEHLEFLDGLRMLRECLRILKPGGSLRLAMPDLDSIADLFKTQKTPEQIDYIKQATDDWFPKLKIYNECLAANHIFYLYDHRFLYNKATLQAVLEEIGYTNVVSVDPGCSADPALRNLECRVDKYSLYETMVVEAKAKPN